MLHPFQNTWPYERIMGDLYVSECPFCSSENVLLPMKPSVLSDIRDGKKKRLVFPCCHHVATLVDADNDYVLADIPLRDRKA